MALARTVGVAGAAGRGAVATVVGLARGRGRWPAGVNDWADRGGGTPVVLIPGSFVPGEFYWHRLAPGLIADGHRVFACNLPGLGTREPQVQVAAVEQFLRRVRKATGQRRVVLVGQSFGGVVIRDVVRSTAAEVGGAVLVSAQDHGFRRGWAALFTAPVVRGAVRVVCPMALRLIPGSEYLDELDAASTGRSITTITSTRDAFAAPASVAVDGADNIVLQELDPSIRSGHMLIGYDPVAVDLIRAAVASAS
ncbi:esterase/lipase family protein [Gordonia sp. (in: high G+C Gram-positive bacteria)]|uniref:esterase/lipase family protein n=1 Tax=Gordonia sp. (in: high G+C Gram-positive bacteria) TaxID=84139 RepID=UPI0039E2D483